MSAALRELMVELRECRTDYDGRIMSDNADPMGCDCGVLRRSEEAITALLAKSAEYDALVALPAAWRAWRNDPDHPADGCASDERAAEIFDRCADELDRLLVSDDRPSTVGDGNG